MPPKLSTDQIDSKLVEIRDFVRGHLSHLAAKASVSLKHVFHSYDDKTGFYRFLHRYEERFSEPQRRYADETFALLAQYAETGCRAASSNDPQRDRSRSVRRRTASGTVTNSGAPQPAPLKRRRCNTKRPALIGDDVPSAETAQSIHPFGSRSAHSASGSAHSAAVSLPPLDASIIEEVQKLGRHPLELYTCNGKEFSREEQDERSLARKIRKNFSKLLSDTVSYLSRLKLEYKWIEDVVEAAEKLHRYKRKLTKEKGARLWELRRRLQLMSQVQPHHVLKNEKFDNSKVSHWWSTAGICEQPMVPKWCLFDESKSSATQVKISLWEFHYHLSHQLLREVDAFCDGDSHPVAQSASTNPLYSDFFASCRSAERRTLEPFPARLAAQCRSGSFAPHHCLRQLALIECPNKTLKDIPNVYKMCPVVRERAPQAVKELSLPWFFAYI